MNKKGFTLIELILVIAILGILAVSALPKFIDLSDKAHGSARDGVVGAVRSGIALYRANDLANNGTGDAPNSLESGDCCFGAVLDNPADGWSVATNTYTYSATGDSYNYNSANGQFKKN